VPNIITRDAVRGVYEWCAAGTNRSSIGRTRRYYHLMVLLRPRNLARRKN